MNKVIVILIVITIVLPFNISKGEPECGLRQSARAKANRRSAREVNESDPGNSTSVDLDGSESAAIVGGSYADPGDFCWQCSMTLNGRQHCGATVISDRYVLTAAHCLTIPGKRVVKCGGMYWYSGSAYPAARVIIHPGYSPNSMKNDIGLIELADPVRFSRGSRTGNGAICPACLPQAGQTFSGMLVASGWGATREGGRKSDKMKWVHLLHLKPETCASAYPHYKRDSQICAGFVSGGRDTCQGDSGGPLIKFVKNSPEDKEKLATIIGVVSNGNGCAQAGYPGIYTMVSYYERWINQQMTNQQ